MWIFWVIVVLRSNVIYEFLTPRDFAIIELPREPLVSFLAVVVVARDRVHFDQMCAFTTDFDRVRAGYSPDRLDALVWGLTELLVEPIGQGYRAPTSGTTLASSLIPRGFAERIASRT